MPFFDTAPFSSLYGSFVDGYYTGSLLVTKTGPNSVTTNPNRGPIVSVVSSTLDPSVINNLLNPVNFNNSFTEYRTAATQSKTIINKNIRFLQAVTQNEFFYDSFIPDINTIFNVDGGKLILMNNNRGDNEPIFEFEFVFGSYIYSQSLNQFVQHTLTSSNGTQISNNKWLYSFPYQIKYGSAIRLRGNPFTLSNLSYTVSGAIDTTAPFSNGKLIAYDGINERPITVLPTYDYWNTIFATTFGQNSGVIFSFLFPSGTLPTSTTAIYDEQFSTLRGVIADKDPYLSGTLDYQVTLPPIMPLTASTTKTNIKFIYGFGDGFAGFGEFVTDVPNTIQDYALSSVFFGSLIRGWKYGLKSGFPEQTKVLIDRNFYGGLFSILGSRPYSAFFNDKTGQITYPIQVQFLSGTQAFATYSNQTTLNTRESGVFDGFYRVGIPFYET